MKISTLLYFLSLVCSFNFAIGQHKFSDKLSDAELGLTKQKVVYDPGYFSIGYPNGDVSGDKGVCTDVVMLIACLNIRSLGIIVLNCNKKNIGKKIGAELIYKQGINFFHHNHD